MPYDADSVGWDARDFPGAFSNGIHIGSTIAQVIAAFGPPDEPVKRGLLQAQMEYKKPGLTIGMTNKQASNLFLEPVAPSTRP